MAMIDQLNELEAQATQALAEVQNQAGLIEWKSTYLGKQGALPRLSRSLGALPPEERPLAGQKFNQARQKLEQLFASHEQRLRRASRMD